MIKVQACSRSKDILVFSFICPQFLPRCTGSCQRSQPPMTSLCREFFSKTRMNSQQVESSSSSNIFQVTKGGHQENCHPRQSVNNHGWCHTDATHVGSYFIEYNN